MKKRLFSIVLYLMLLLSLCVTAYAADGYYLIDEPGLLTQEEAETLESRAAELTDRYGIGVYIAIVNDFTDYASDCETAAQELYLSNGFGVGDNQNGIMLFLSMADRDYDLAAHGTDAHLAFTDYGKEQLAEEFLDDFRYDDWYTGFEDYLSTCDRMLSAAEQGQPVDTAGGHGQLYYEDESNYGSDYEDESNYGSDYEESYDSYSGGSMLLYRLIWGPAWLASAVVGILLSLLICWLVKNATMKSVAAKREAGNYVCGEMQFRIRNDQFTHTTQTRRKIERDPPDSGGGTHVNSSDFSHSGGKF